MDNLSPSRRSRHHEGHTYTVTPPTSLGTAGLVAVVLTLAGIATGCGTTETEPGQSAQPDSSAPTPTPTATSSPSSIAPTTTAASPGLTAQDICAATARPDSPAVASPQLIEVSGIVVSRQHDGVIWAHNDSGGGAFIYAIESDGRDLGTWSVDASSIDWEDIALIATDAGDQLIIADIGDNFHLRNNGRLIRLIEPVDLHSPGAITADTITVSYPDGQPDAETILVDSATLEVVIVARDTTGDDHAIYTATLPSSGSAKLELTRAGSVSTDEYVSGGDLSPDGSLIALRTPSKILIWDRAPGAPLAETLGQAPACSTKSAQPEAQGEAIAFLSTGTGLVTISEGQFPAINLIDVAN